MERVGVRFSGYIFSVRKSALELVLLRGIVHQARESTTMTCKGGGVNSRLGVRESAKKKGRACELINTKSWKLEKFLFRPGASTVFLGYRSFFPIPGIYWYHIKH